MAAESSAPLWISLGSLLVSGVALGWNIYRDAIDRGKLRLSCYIGMIGQPGVGIVADNLLIWAVTNIGRQPVMASKIGGTRKAKPHTWLLLPPKGEPLPKMLKPGETYTGYSDDLPHIPTDIETLWTMDTLGRTYRAPRRQVREIFKKLAEMRATKQLKEATR